MRVTLLFRCGESVTLTLEDTATAHLVTKNLSAAMTAGGKIVTLTDDSGPLGVVRADDLAAIVLPR